MNFLDRDAHSLHSSSFSGKAIDGSKLTCCPCLRLFCRRHHGGRPVSSGSNHLPQSRKSGRSLQTAEMINPEVLRYLNRLSDLLFVLARVCNRHGQADILWVPERNRSKG